MRRSQTGRDGGVEWELGRDVPQWEEHVQRPWGGNKLGLFKGQKEARVAEHGEWLRVSSERWVGTCYRTSGPHQESGFYSDLHGSPGGFSQEAARPAFYSGELVLATV